MAKPTSDQLGELSLLAHLLGDYAISLQEGEELLPGQQRRLEEVAAGCGMELKDSQWTFEGEPCLEDLEKLSQELSHYNQTGRLRDDRRSGRLLIAIAQGAGVAL